MIIMHLMGGLGNQMFQYALGRRLSIEQNTNLKLDLSWFDSQTKRDFKLQVFYANFQLVTSDELKIINKNISNKILRKFYIKFQNLLPYQKRMIIIENKVGSFDKKILQVKKPCFLVGYWQSEKYFSKYRDILIEDFTPKLKLDEYSRKIQNKIMNCNSVGIHIRRGDYFVEPKTNHYHGVLDKDYYLRSINYINRVIYQPHFFLFSDDIEWVKEYMDIPYPSTFVEHNKIGQDFVDLWLMTQCQHQIIANSSFSWWGGWLNKYPQKIVIAPKKWFSDPSRSSDGIVPENWIKL